VRWLISIADRTHPLALPGIWVLVGVSVLSRVGFYLIIPPLAWVGAALVETLVQGYIE